MGIKSSLRLTLIPAEYRKFQNNPFRRGLVTKISTRTLCNRKDFHYFFLTQVIYKHLIKKSRFLIHTVTKIFFLFAKLCFLNQFYNQCINVSCIPCILFSQKKWRQYSVAYYGNAAIFKPEKLNKITFEIVGRQLNLHLHYLQGALLSIVSRMFCPYPLDKVLIFRHYSSLF